MQRRFLHGLFLALSLLFVFTGTWMIAVGAPAGASTLLFGGACLTTFLGLMNGAVSYAKKGTGATILQTFPGPARLHAPRARQMLVFVSTTLWAGALILFAIDDPPEGLAVLLVWPAIILFTIGVPFAALALLRGATLEMNAQGFELRSGLQRYSLPWSEASGFRAFYVPPAGHPGVVYDNAALASRVARANRFISGGSSGLSETYGLPPEELADLLNAWRAKALDAGPNP